MRTEDTSKKHAETGDIGKVDINLERVLHRVKLV